jgi:hypothetical protein
MVISWDDGDAIGISWDFHMWRDGEMSFACKKQEESKGKVISYSTPIETDQKPPWLKVASK